MEIDSTSSSAVHEKTDFPTTSSNLGFYVYCCSHSLNLTRRVDKIQRNFRRYCWCTTRIKLWRGFCNIIKRDIFFKIHYCQQFRYKFMLYGYAFCLHINTLQTAAISYMRFRRRFTTRRDNDSLLKTFTWMSIKNLQWFLKLHKIYSRL